MNDDCDGVLLDCPDCGGDLCCNWWAPATYCARDGKWYEVEWDEIWTGEDDIPVANLTGKSSDRGPNELPEFLE